ncbi:kinase-like domain-containing protein [Nemania abortiva]|nr:kinase-like domain-containing protein [Nemania abortiva]
MVTMTAPRVHDLRKRIVASLRQSAWTDAYQRYISKADIDNITSEENILSIVEEDQTIEPERKKGFSDYIYKSSRILFAMFIYYGIPITHLLTLPYTDNDLPIPTRLIIEDMEIEDTSLEFVQHIPGGQWMFLPTQFFVRGSHQELDPNAILPFRSMDLAGTGTFGTVYKVETEPSHLNHVSIRCSSPLISRLSRDILQGSGQPLALKVISRRKATDGMNERKLLEGLRSIGHPHIIELLTSFERERELGMFFPLATCDLDYYMGEKGPLIDDQFVSWFLTQLCGLTDALSKIHEYDRVSTTSISSSGGYHLDLKPQNILFFQDSTMPRLQGVFKLSDFGARRLGTPKYAAPEAELEDTTPSDVQDMWSFGCVILELLIWIHDGPPGRARSTVGIDKFFKQWPDGGFYIHNDVRRAIEQLSFPRCNAVLHEILRTVIDRLLVWDPQARWSAAGLLSALNCISGE